jgi:Uma2 family endonuclease
MVDKTTLVTLEALLEPIRSSPFLPEIADALQRELEAEKQLRAKFYQKMTPSEKAEFIGGKVIMHAPARNGHLDTTKHILQLLDVHVRTNDLGEIKSEKCLCVFPRNDYEPDVVFFSKEKAADFDDKTMKFPIPDLIVEVLSESTELRDRGVKFEDYAAHGVGEYWIVDAEKGVVEQYLLNDGGYFLEAKNSSGEILSRVIEGFRAPVRAFFDTKENLAALRSALG